MRWPLGRPVGERYADAADPDGALAYTVIAVVLLLVAGMFLASALIALWLTWPDSTLFVALAVVAGGLGVLCVVAAWFRELSIDSGGR